VDSPTAVVVVEEGVSGAPQLFFDSANKCDSGEIAKALALLAERWASVSEGSGVFTELLSDIETR